MFRAFLLNRWIYAFVSLYKSLNILNEQLEFIYEPEKFLFKKNLKLVHNNNYHN